MTSTINSQILSSVNELKQDNKSIHSNIKLLSSELNNSINSKFQDSKREYIEETKNIIFNNFSQNNDFISNLLIQNTSQLVDKTTLLLNDIIPKSNETQYRQLESSMTVFQKSMEEDTKKLLNAVDKEDSLDKFYNVFETKSNNLLLQPLYSFINATEERIKMFLLLMIVIVFLPMKRYLPIYPTFSENTEIPAIKANSEKINSKLY
jgi:hypothetical protein